MLLWSLDLVSDIRQGMPQITYNVGMAQRASVMERLS